MVTLVSLYKGLIVENLGIHRIEAFLHDHSIQTEVIYLSTMRLHRQFNISCFEDSEIIGISAYANTLQDMALLVKSIKRRYPDKIVFTGSQYFTACYETVLNAIPEIDFGILGAGEFPLKTFIDMYDGFNLDSVIATVPYLISTNHRSNKSVCITDIQDLPWPSHNPKIVGHDLFAYLNTSQGCVGNCSFCGHIRCRWSGRSPSEIVNEMISISNTYNIFAFSFSDNSIEDPGQFGKKRLHEIAKRIIELDSRFALNGFIRADSFSDTEADNAILQDLRKAGFNQFLVGIEAGNTEDLHLYNKRATLTQNKNFLKLLEKHDIHASIGFININPYSTSDRLIRNHEFLKEINNYFPGHYFSYLMVYENTQLFHRIKQDGLLLQNGFEYSYKVIDDFSKEYFEFIKAKYINTSFSQMLMELQNLVKMINYLSQILADSESQVKLRARKKSLALLNIEFFDPFFKSLSFDVLCQSFDEYISQLKLEKDKLTALYSQVLKEYYRNVKR